MDYRRLGRSGLKVSEFSLGAWVTFGKQVGVDDAVNLLACAYDHGINFFDNAEGYESGNAEKVKGGAWASASLAWAKACRTDGRHGMAPSRPANFKLTHYPAGLSYYRWGWPEPTEEPYRAGCPHGV